MLVCANGGHLAEMRLVAENISCPKVWVTYKGEDSSDLDGFKFIDHHNRLIKIIKILVKAPFVIFKINPSCILSTGGIIAIPFAIISKVIGLKGRSQDSRATVGKV